MAGFRIRRVLAGWLVAATAIAVLPAAAHVPAPSTSVVAGSSLQTSFRVDANATSRESTLPGLAALRFATTPQQARDAVTAHLRTLAGAATPPPPAGRLEDAFVVGDLSGDGRKDLVLIETLAGELNYVAVSGVTGKRLWSAAAAAGPDHFAVALPLSGAGSRGALLITTTYEEVPSDAMWTLRVATTVTAVGADGAQRWTRTLDGAASFSEAGIVFAGMGYPLGVAPLNGPGDDVAIRTDDTVYSFAGGGTSRIEILDGATGTVGAVMEAASQDEGPASNVVSDLDGDGFHDVVTASSAGGQVLAVAHSGIDGRPLWRSNFEAMPVYWVDSGGRLDKDPAEDLLLVGVDWEGWNFFAFTVVSGADGTPGWQSTSEGLMAAGDINGDNRGDLLLLDDVDTRSMLGIQYKAVTGTGKTLYSRDYGVKPPSGSWFAMLSLGDVGDVDGDGSLDFQHDISVMGFDQGGGASERGVVLTRTGRKVHDGVAGGPLYASVDGRGDDMVYLRSQDNFLLVSVRDGLTGRELWRREVPAKQLRWGYGFGADLTRDGRSEVIVLARKAKAGMALRVLDGRKSTLRWSR